MKQKKRYILILLHDVTVEDGKAEVKKIISNLPIAHKAVKIFEVDSNRLILRCRLSDHALVLYSLIRSCAAVSRLRIVKTSGTLKTLKESR